MSKLRNLNRRSFIGAAGAAGALGIVGGTGVSASAQGTATPKAANGTSGPRSSKGSFELMEATIADIHDAYRHGRLTCRELVQQYLDRIAAYDKQGPSLTALITVNPRALEVADELDRQYRRSGLTGPLHGIPVILKDNYDTFDLPTTGGNTAMRTSVPPTDAFTVDKMRKAGALILAKANLQEFARGGNSLSSLGGQVLNPYDLTRTPGGSSGGTGASIASNFAVLGTGSDTGQSVRSPASACSLVGVRSTRGLISRSGVIPASITQDELGPITRTVEDAAKMLDVMVGFDPADPVTGYGVGVPPRSYADHLRADALKGARIGVMTNLFGTEARHQEVNRVMEEVISSMQAQGATIVRFTLPAYDTLQSIVVTSTWEAHTAMDAYFASLGPDAPVHTFDQLVASKTATPEAQAALEAEIAIVDGLNNATYKDHFVNREKLRLAVSAKMAELNIEAILYPLQKVLVSLVGVPQAERNGTLSNGTGFPAVCFPGGFSTPTASAPLGVPVGAELLGREFSEPLLLSLAYAYEQATKARKLPVSTPAL
ncbi:twin-arginine translocation signal domain-containing protein [Actinacidiphila oryziradicis]|uniref:Twin-arginine translocation signal domain-containing protein n=2 Tax=Actinacidiphila oryziradicis TaxID=2571141 RepID=A0A4U0SIY0_9ACTN|nr:twin-arginine translocation signal domain-containing protein [Actinacidiphila oryziradicis]